MEWMDAIYRQDIVITSVRVQDAFIRVSLSDGRAVDMPLGWFPWLADATPQQRDHIEITDWTADWPDLDSGFSLETVLLGWPDRTRRPDTRSPQTIKQA